MTTSKAIAPTIPAPIATGWLVLGRPSYAILPQRTKMNAVAPAVTTMIGASSAAFSSGHWKSRAETTTRAATAAPATARVLVWVTSARLPRRYPESVGEPNYESGEDYEIEFLGYRFGFNAIDFEERVTAAAVKLQLIAGNEL